MQMKNRKNILMILLFGMFLMTACGKELGTEEPDTESIEEETVVSDNISVEEKKHPNVSYRGESKLYKETIENVLIEFFSIREEKDLYKLADLPLTEEFFKECLADFPYGEESAEEISEIWINTWGIAQDGTCMGLVNVSTDKEKRIPSQSHFKSYYVVMKLKNEQIDSMEIKLVGKYPNTTITKLGDGCARKEVEFD